MPNCISRGFFALKIRPKFGLPKILLGKSKFARFSKLKISQRNSSSDVPTSLHVLASAKSMLANPGPTTLLRGALPNLNGAWRANADVSNQRSGVL